MGYKQRLVIVLGNKTPTLYIGLIPIVVTVLGLGMMVTFNLTSNPIP